MLTTFSRHIVYPLMNLRNSFKRLSVTRQMERDQWASPDDLEARQRQRLRSLLHYCARHVPYYRQLFDSVGFNPERVNLPEDLAKLPILTKEQIRDSGAALLSDEFSLGDSVEARTGGSTGVALTIYADRACQAARNAAGMRSDGWAGWKPGTRIAAAWGNPPSFTTLRPWLRNTLYNRLLFLDTMRMSDESMRAFFAECNRESAYVLYGHAHSLYLYAAFLREQGLRPNRPAGIIATSMMLLDPERRIIESVFGIPVSNRYGCEEVGLIASECERHQGLHLNTDHVFVELLDDDGQPVADGTEGNVAVTDLINRGQPLIRYLLGDRAVRARQACGCGRGLPLLERVTGRTADFLVRTDGSRVAGISMIERTLTLVEGIKQLQIVQMAVEEFVLRVVPDAAYSPDSEAQLRAEFADTFGPGTRVAIELTEGIERTASGRYRFSICHVPPPVAERAAAAPQSLGA